MASRIFKASIIIGGGIAGSLRSAFSSTDGGLKRIGSAIADLDRRQRLMGSSIAAFGRQGMNVDSLRAKYAQLTTQTDKLRAAQQRLAKVDSAVQANMAKRGEYRGQMLEAVGMVAVAAAPVKLAIDYESAFADVKKVVDFTSEEQERAVSKAVRRLSTELPMAAKDIAGIVAAGGQSGLGVDELEGFAESAIKRGVAFNMTAEEAGQMMAELRSAFRMNQGEVNTLTDKMNLLANTTAASEVKIANVVQRVGPLGEVAGMASGEIAALGATLVSMGVQEEVAATGIQNLMLGLVAGEAATKKQSEAFKRLGMDTGQVAKDMQTDAQGTIMRVLGAVQKLEEHERASILQQMFGKESIKAIAPLLNNTDALAANLAKVTDETLYAGAVEKEYAARAATSANNIQLFKNRIADLGISLGNTLLPAINSILGKIGPMVTKFSDFAERNPGVTKAIVGTASALVGLRLAAIAGGYAFTFIKGPILSVLGFIQRWRAGTILAQLGRTGPTIMRMVSGFRLVATAIAAIGGGPIALLIAGITVAALLVRKYWEPIKAFMGGLWEGIAAAASQTWSEIKAAFAPIQPQFAAIAAALRPVWQWISNLLAPTQASASSLQTMGTIGRAVGQMLFVNFRAVVMVVGWVVKAVATLGNVAFAVGAMIGTALGAVWNTIKEPAGAAIDWIMAKLQPLIAAMKWVADRAGSLLGAVGGKVMDAVRSVADGGGPAAQPAAAQPAEAAAPAATVGAAAPRPAPLPSQAAQPGRAAAAVPPVTPPHAVKPGAAAAAAPQAAAPIQQVAPKATPQVVIPGQAAANATPQITVHAAQASAKPSPTPKAGQVAAPAPAPKPGQVAAAAPAPGKAAPAVIAVQPAASPQGRQAPQLPAPGSAQGRQAPPMPQPQSRTPPPSNTTVNQTNTYNITQGPGESSADLARRITAEQKRQSAVQGRSSMADKG